MEQAILFEINGMHHLTEKYCEEENNFFIEKLSCFFIHIF